jgi:hypothetical protein
MVEGEPGNDSVWGELELEVYLLETTILISYAEYVVSRVGSMTWLK